MMLFIGKISPVFTLQAAHFCLAFSSSLLLGHIWKCNLLQMTLGLKRLASKWVSSRSLKRKPTTVKFPQTLHIHFYYISTTSNDLLSWFFISSTWSSRVCSKSWYRSLWMRKLRESCLVVNKKERPHVLRWHPQVFRECLRISKQTWTHWISRLLLTNSVDLKTILPERELLNQFESKFPPRWNGIGVHCNLHGVVLFCRDLGFVSLCHCFKYIRVMILLLMSVS